MEITTDTTDKHWCLSYQMFRIMDTFRWNSKAPQSSLIIRCVAGIRLWMCRAVCEWGCAAKAMVCVIGGVVPWSKVLGTVMNCYCPLMVWQVYTLKYALLCWIVITMHLLNLLPLYPSCLQAALPSFLHPKPWEHTAFHVPDLHTCSIPPWVLVLPNWLYSRREFSDKQVSACIMVSNRPQAAVA